MNAPLAFTGTIERDPGRLFAPPDVEVIRRADGSMLLRSPHPLLDFGRCMGDWLVHWARLAPVRHFLLERGPDGEWRGVTYSQALDDVQRIAAWLLQKGLSAERPVVILSDNSVEHGLLALAAMHVGIPVVAVSPAYSLVSSDFVKLKAILSMVNPGVLYVADAERFSKALAAVQSLHRIPVLDGSGRRTGLDVVPFSEARNTPTERHVADAFSRVGPNTIAKLLFTSGSTGVPKGVLTTQRMLCANQQQLAQVWPFLEREPPIIVDWLPWSHTFGGSHNFNLILRSGGTLYIDHGKPLPQHFDHSLRNLREIAPTIYFNVPRGFDMLVAALRDDHELRKHFFSRLHLLFYAAAALPQNLWDSLDEFARDATGTSVPMVSGWGATETAPLATTCHFVPKQAGVIGLPVPGCELKLIPQGIKIEVRVRGPNVTAGYLGQAAVTATSFDEEGFYLIGDAVRLVDKAHPELGLRFDGRISEDFKLSTGTWVNASGLRIKAVAALAPLVQDVVVAGEDRNEIGLLVFPNLPACRQLCADLPGNPTTEAILANPVVRESIQRGLRELRNAGAGSSTYATRALLLLEPPSIDAGEITDKGYINQRKVLARRRTLEEQLFGASPEVVHINNQ